MRLARPSIALTLVCVSFGTIAPAMRPPLVRPFSVAGFGDSLTIGCAPGSSYLSHLPPDWSRTPLGEPGELAIPGQVRLRAALPRLVELGVDVVVVMWGTADAYAADIETRGLGDWRDPILAEMAESLDRLIAAGIKPIVVFPPPTLDPSPAGVRANERLFDLEWLVAMEALARDVPFIDLFAAILEEPDPSAYFASDGIHLNDAGGAFAARQIERALWPLHAAWLAERRPI